MKRQAMLLLTAIMAALLLAGGTVLAQAPDVSANTGEDKAAKQAKAADAALDLSLKELVAMRGGPPGVIAVV